MCVLQYSSDDTSEIAPAVEQFPGNPAEPVARSEAQGDNTSVGATETLRTSMPPEGIDTS
jgi:hypothetical protein